MQFTMQQLIMLGCIQYLLFIISITFHEAAHAWAAYRLGDSTAFEGGQVTLNPLPHIQREPAGTVIIPILSLVFNNGLGLIGWGSAPYNSEWAERFPKRQFLMAMAGPAANLLLALFGLIAMNLMLRYASFETIEWYFEPPLKMLLADNDLYQVKIFGLLYLHVFLNLMLFVFNLIPVPPLDGSSIWRLILDRHSFYKYQTYANNPTFVILGIVAASGLMRKVLLPIVVVVIERGLSAFQ